MEIKSDSQPPKKELPLPQLRKDIKIYRGPDDADGSPTYNLYDPVRAQFFKISWTEAIVFQELHPGMTLPQLIEVVNRQATFKVTADEIKAFFVEASRNNLLDIARPSEDVFRESEQRKTGWFSWFIYHYLYFRVPLLNPDQFLAKTLPYVEPLASPLALTIYFLITLTGLFFLVTQFDAFIHTFTYFFSIQGLVIYGVAITTVKLIHEFSHAYVAKHFRLYVPAMGVAVIVLWPVFYTDVTEGWKLAKRSQRLAISFAGIAAELVLAGISTLGWVLSEPGLMQSVFFVIASVTWISTMVVNLNPAMRFDGYYLACDLTGIDNLQMRAFAFTRWQLRKWLLGLEVPCPEEIMTPKRKWGMIFYSLYTWIYRVTLYTAIAIFVYFEFTKALGIFLFLIEIGVFILLPIYWELVELKMFYPQMKVNPRLMATLSILGLLLVWFIMPLPHQVKFAGISIPEPNQVVYSPQSGFIKQINVKIGDAVKRGEVLVQMFSKELDLSIKEKEAEIESLKAQVKVLSLDESNKSFMPEKQAELAMNRAKLKGLTETRDELTLRSTIDGIVYQWDDSLHVNQAIEKFQVMGRIASPKTVNVLFYVPENQLGDIKIGQEVVFRSTGNFEEYSGKVIDIRTGRSSILPYPQLASINQGPLPVSEEPAQKNEVLALAPGEEPSNRLVLVETYFPVEVKLEKDHEYLRFGTTGQVIVEGEWESMLWALIRRGQAVFWRESGF